MSQITQTFVGAEIDGTTLRVVRLEGRTVVYYEKFRQLNSSAVASVMHQGKSKNTRAVLSWGSSGVAMQRVQAPGVVARKMQPVIRELINRHLPSGSELPGAVSFSRGLMLQDPLQWLARSLQRRRLICAMN